ncbi:MAG: hypothetical protein F4081_07535 [Dehalococcoidia bacterium]|nr:hypothetical protein [Dehalococcoidia bacterium]MYI86620.1 hypothetical protein [Dehalococcoidia bacterium]
MSQKYVVRLSDTSGCHGGKVAGQEQWYQRHPHKACNDPEMSMVSYIGNGPYCYANSAAMLLESVGETVEPRLLEVLSGVGLGAFWLAESQTLFLSGWASMPDVGVSRAFGLLGFKVAEEAESDGAPMPAEALARQLDDGPVLLGPLDVGELPYQPDSQGGNGVDHFVLALGFEGDEVVVHDPDGYPAVPIALEALDRAWRADLIEYRRGTYRRWHSPTRTTSPVPEEIANKAIRSFAWAYRESRATALPGVAIGPEAVEALVATLRDGALAEQGLEHLRRFALPLGVRRALDYAWFLQEVAPELAELKSEQARRLGRAHAAAARPDQESMAEHLSRVADLERRVEAALA